MDNKFGHDSKFVDGNPAWKEAKKEAEAKVKELFGHQINPDNAPNPGQASGTDFQGIPPSQVEVIKEIARVTDGVPTASEQLVEDVMVALS